MHDHVIVRIDEKLVPQLQILFDSNSLTVIKQTISSWSEIQKDAQLVIILAGQLVYTTKANIPSKNEEVIRQSIPYAIEEQLADDIADNHFAYTRVQDQQFLVSVVHKKIMETLRKQLSSHQLNCEQLYSEIFTIPVIKESNSIGYFKDHAIFRGSNSATSIDQSMINLLIKQSKFKKTTLYKDFNTAIDEPPLVEIIDKDLDLFQAKTLINELKVNLFQGDYLANKDKKHASNVWKKVIISASLLVASWFIINFYQLWSINKNIDEIKNKQKSLLMEIVPNASNNELKDPFSALKSRLQISKKDSTVNSNFIESLNYIGKIMIDFPTLQLQSLRQRDNKLEIKIIVDNTSMLNQFQNKLENIAINMRVKTGTRQTIKEGISSIITMEKL